MKKRIFIMLLCMVVGMSTMSVSGFAETSMESYEIDNLDTLQKEISLVADEDGQISKVDVKEFIENTSPQVIEEYREEQFEKLEETLDGQQFTMENSEIVDGVETQEYDILVDEETGAKVHITLQDQSEPSMDERAEGPQNKTGTSTEADKLVGDRYFTGSCYYQSGLVAIRIYLENHYKVTSALGLAERYPTIKQVQGMAPYCESSAEKAEDGHILKASGVGNSIKYRIHAMAKILPIAGGALTTYHYYADSKVTILKKISGGLHVRQSLTWNF